MFSLLLEAASPLFLGEDLLWGPPGRDLAAHPNTGKAAVVVVGETGSSTVPCAAFEDPQQAPKRDPLPSATDPRVAGGPARPTHRRPPRVPEEDALNASHAGSAPAGRQPLAFSMTGKRLPSPLDISR